MKAIKLNMVGIDVGSKELVLKLEKSGKLQDGVSTFVNDKAGHKKLVKYITKHNAKARVCMEATGIYHFDLALLLHETKNVEVMVVNPKAIKHFGIASMKRSKTDLLDASTILSYLKYMEFVSWQAPSKDKIEIQALSRRIHQLKAEIQRENCRRHAGDYKNILTGVINNDIDVNIKHIERRIKLLENNVLQIINASVELKEKYDLLITIKGIAQTSGIQILSEIACLASDMKPAQWVAYAGLDPRAFESGATINKPRRISKAGNKYLRTALYMPAWVAVQSEPNVKAFYDKLIAAGKKPMQAIVAVMRKLLHSIWGILYSNTPWNGEKFYHVKN